MGGGGEGTGVGSDWVTQTGLILALPRPSLETLVWPQHPAPPHLWYWKVTVPRGGCARPWGAGQPRGPDPTPTLPLLHL